MALAFSSYELDAHGRYRGTQRGVETDFKTKRISATYELSAVSF